MSNRRRCRRRRHRKRNRNPVIFKSFDSRINKATDIYKYVGNALAHQEEFENITTPWEKWQWFEGELAQISPILKKKCKKSSFKKFHILHFQWTFSTFQIPPVLKEKCKNQSFKNYIRFQWTFSPSQIPPILKKEM